MEIIDNKPLVIDDSRPQTGEQNLKKSSKNVSWTNSPFTKTKSYQAYAAPARPYDLWKTKLVTTGNKEHQTYNKKLAL